MVNIVPDADAGSRVGSPGGPLASKTFIIVTLHKKKEGSPFRKFLSLQISKREETHGNILNQEKGNHRRARARKKENKL